MFSPSLSSSMNFHPSPFRQHPSQQQHQQQFQHGMMNPEFFNPFFIGRQNFGGGNRQYRNHFRLPHFPQQPFHLPSMTYSDSIPMPQHSSSPPFTLSSNGSIKDETPREIFFRTLSSSLKAANKRFSGKTTTWKNPFLYKTNLCVNYSRRSFCRFGVNCWYAHGEHELRCIPESDELPEPAFIIQYLSFLGLPSQYLEQIIQEAYCIAKYYQTFTNSPTSSSSNQEATNPSLFVSTSAPSPTINNAVTDPLNTPKSKNDRFYSSLASNGGWADIENALNGIVGNDGNFFGNSFTPHQS